MAEINKNIIYDNEILQKIFTILDESEDSFKPIYESDEDRLEKLLEEKYKDAITWRGPLLRGVAGRMNGFEFRVYSADHNPKHFHIIHKARGIDARFSFPQIELINYKGLANIIGKKESDRIYEFFKITENYKKLESEFQKQLS